MMELDEFNFDRVLRVLTLLGVVGFAGGCLFAMFGKVFWVFELASHFMLPLAIFGVVVFGGSLWVRVWRLVVVAGLFLGWVAFQLVPYLVDTGGEEVGGRATYRVAVLNLLLENRESDAVLDFLEAEDADVLLLQEVTPWWERRLRGDLVKRYPHRVLEARSHAFGIWLLSKFPLDDVRVLPEVNQKIPYLAASVDFDGRDVWLVGVHPLPPTGRSQARARNERLRDAAELVAGRDGARVLLGDLNCTPWSPYFSEVLRAGDLRDSGKWCGWAPTWGRGKIRIPIDHCLVSEELGVGARRVGPDIGSDHRGVVVDLFFR